MAAVAAADIFVYEQHTGLSKVANAPSDNKEILVETAATVDDTDTVAVDVSLYGMSVVDYVKGFTHTTDNNVVIVEAPTTAVSGTTLTITVGGSTDNKKRVFIVGGH